MDALFLFLALLVMITIGGLFLILSHSPAPQHASAKKIDGTDFLPSQMYMGGDSLGGLAVNERTRQICLLKSSTSPPELFPINDLVGSYLVKNGEIIGEGKRNHPKETVIFLQGLHRQKESLITNLHMEASSEGRQRIDLLVMVRDLNDPILVVNFLDMETKEGGILFEKALSTATHWHYVLDGLILEADHLTKTPSEATQGKQLAEARP